MVLSKSDLCAIHLAAECEFSVAFVNHQSRLLLSIEGNKNIFSDTHYNTKLLTPQPQAHEMKAITVSKAVQPPRETGAEGGVRAIPKVRSIDSKWILSVRPWLAVAPDATLETHPLQNECEAFVEAAVSESDLPIRQW